jgi:hypothetical protein
LIEMMAAALDQPPFASLAGSRPNDAASITPPHSANGKKEAPDGVPAELSDLELDPGASAVKIEDSVEGEEDVIEPDHYYGGGKIPVFKPVSLAISWNTLLANHGLTGQPADDGTVS